MGKHVGRADKQSLRKGKTTGVILSVAELEAVYVLCSTGKYKRPVIQTRAVNKIREALLNAVLDR